MYIYNHKKTPTRTSLHIQRYSITNRNKQDVIYEVIYSLKSSGSQIVKLNHTFYLGIRIGNTYTFIYIYLHFYCNFNDLYETSRLVPLTVGKNVYLISLI